MGRDMLTLYIAELIGVAAVTMLLGLSKRFKPLRILTFRYPKREAMVAFSLFVVTFIASLYFFRVPGIKISYTTTTPEGILPRLVLGGLCVLVCALALRLRKQPIRSAGWNRPQLMPGFQLGLALGFLTLFLGGKLTTLFKGIAADQVTMLFYWLGIGLAEESIFRGYIQLRLSAWLGKWAGIAATAVLSTLWLLPLWLQLPGETALLQAGLTFSQALVVGWVAQRSNHVLGGAIYRAFSGWLMML